MDAIKESQYVIHVATHVEMVSEKYLDKVQKPAVLGTTFVMKACLEYKVKRIVVTSSVAAIIKPGKSTLTEEDWADPYSAPPYQKSKTLAEKVVW